MCTRRRRRTRVTDMLVLVMTSSVLLIASELLVQAFVDVRNVGPDYTTYDPHDGKRLRPGVSTVRHTPDFTMHISTNSLGFRGPEPVGFPARGVLFLGDSFTEGYGVDDGHEFPALVRADFEARNLDVPVVNAGLENTGNGRWLRFLEREGERFDPVLVVLQLMKNDFRDNVNERLYSLSADGELLAYPVPPPDLRRRLKLTLLEHLPIVEESHLVGLVGQAWTSLANANRVRRGAGIIGDVTEEDARLTFRLLEAVLDLCRERGWPVLVLNVGIDGPRRDRLTTILSDRDVPAVEVPDWSVRPDLYHPADRHWNDAGHAEAAARLLKRMGPLSNAEIPSSAGN